MAFAYLGTKQQPIGQPRSAAPGTARFEPIAGQNLAVDGPGPRLVDPSEGIGVYAAEPVRFDQAGVWGVSVTATIDGKKMEAKTIFEVQAKAGVPLPGDVAPRSENHLPGAAGIPPKAVDSRSGVDGSVPDPELHSTTVAAAMAAGRPAMVVVSTPVY